MSYVQGLSCLLFVCVWSVIIPIEAFIKVICLSRVCHIQCLSIQGRLCHRLPFKLDLFIHCTFVSLPLSLFFLCTKLTQCLSSYKVKLFLSATKKRIGVSYFFTQIAVLSFNSFFAVGLKIRMGIGGMIDLQKLSMTVSGLFPATL